MTGRDIIEVQSEAEARQRYDAWRESRGKPPVFRLTSAEVRKEHKPGCNISFGFCTCFWEPPFGMRDDNTETFPVWIKGDHDERGNPIPVDETAQQRDARIESWSAEPALPELPVTEEMIAAALSVDDALDIVNNWADFPSIYRAMAAVAPRDDASPWAEFKFRCWQTDVDKRIEAENDRDAWASKCGEATERALRAEREKAELFEKFVRVSNAYAEIHTRLAERDASLVRATGRRG